MNRRSLLLGLSGLIVAPAVVRSGVIMPVKVWREPLLVHAYTMMDEQWHDHMWQIMQQMHDAVISNEGYARLRKIVNDDYPELAYQSA